MKAEYLELNLEQDGAGARGRISVFWVRVGDPAAIRLKRLQFKEVRREKRREWSNSSHLFGWM